MSSTTSIRTFTQGSSDERPAVLCFPHAGGCASFFRPWQGLLPGARVHAVQYPGREDRIAEEHPPSLTGLAQAVADDILASGETYSVLFGHSMGAYVAFEAARQLERAGAGVPVLVVSSAAAPGLRPPVPFEDTADVLGYLGRYEPLSVELLQDEDLMELILDYIKADLRLAAHYDGHRDKRVAARLVAVAGEDDIPEIRTRIEQWQQHTAGAFVPLVMPGGHFYLRTEPPFPLIADELARSLTAVGSGS